MSSIFFYEPFYDIDRLVDEAFSGPAPPRRIGRGNEAQLQQMRKGDAMMDGAIRPMKPRMDLHEDKQKNLVTATFELPGLKKEDVNIQVNNGRLTVSAESNLDSNYEASGYAVKERRHGKLSRTLQLSQGLDERDIKATLEHGILTVTFPQSAPELAPKKIAIS